MPHAHHAHHGHAHQDSSYHRYKEDTNVFTTWVTTAAQKCGYKITAVETNDSSSASPSQPTKSTRLKGKERKLAKKAAGPAPGASNEPPKRYQVSVAELLRQAEAVASRAKDGIRMPSNVQRVLERAIAARQRCTNWFKRTGVQNKFSNEGHQYFINALERSLELLRGSRSSSPTPHSQAGADHASAELLGNRFAALDMADESELELDVEDLVQSETTAAKVSGKKPPPAAYELESEVWDVAFAIFCFFEDVHRLHKHLLQTWRRHKDGQIDLVSATVATTIALDLLAHSEAQLHHEYQQHFTCGRMYDDFTTTIFFADRIRGGDTLEQAKDALRSTERLEILDFDEFVFLPTARVLMKFAQLSKVLDVAAWPPPVPPMRFNYIVNPALLDDPRIKSYEEEDRLLSQMLLDMCLVDDMSKQMKQMKADDSMGRPPVIDVLFSYLQEVWEYEHVSLANVLAARIWLDVLKMYDGRPSSADGLAVEVAHLQNSFKFEIDTFGTMDCGGGVRWLAKDNDLLLGMYQLKQKLQHPVTVEAKRLMSANRGKHQAIDMDDPNIDPVMREALMKQLKEKHPDWTPPEQKHVDNAKRMDIKSIEPHDDLNFMVNYNPLYAGTAILRMAVKSEEAGIALANHHMSIFATAHLYNALQKHGIMETSWPALDRIMALQCLPIFAAQKPEELPGTPHAMLTAVQLRVGLKGINPASFNKKMSWKLQRCGAGVGMESLVSGDDLRRHAAHVLQDDWLAEKDPKSKYQTRRRHVSLIRFVDEFTEVMPTLIRDIRIDYIGLTRICNALMVAIRAALLHELGVDYPSMRQPGESNDHGVVMIPVGVLADNVEAEKAYQKSSARRAGMRFEGGEQLRVAGKAMERFLRSNHLQQIVRVIHC